MTLAHWELGYTLLDHQGWFSFEEEGEEGRGERRGKKEERERRGEEGEGGSEKRGME